MNLRRILVAIDGSEYSGYALNVAMKIAERYTSRIELLHVRSPRSGIPVVPAPSIDPVMGAAPSMILPATFPADRAKTETKEKSDDLLTDRLKIILGRGLESSAQTSQAADVGNEILKFAKSGDYDLMVVGSRGLGGLKNLLLGSVSSKVAKEAKRSVLVVKTRIENVVPKIMLGYDGSEESKKALEFAEDLGKKLYNNARVDVVSVFNVPVSPEAYLGTEVDRWEKEMRQQLESAVARLRSDGLTSDGKVLDHTNVSGALAEAAEKGSYDLIVVGSRGLGRLKSLFLGSVANGIANSAKTNILIVR
ncbi:MAG: universal stress protein [Nitrososphaerales archaeon]